MQSYERSAFSLVRSFRQTTILQGMLLACYEEWEGYEIFYKRLAVDRFKEMIKDFENYKDSTTYLLTEMTQKEFEERCKGWEIVRGYQFNRIKRSQEVTNEHAQI